jgi:hypothetical protein
MQRRAWLRGSAVIDVTTKITSAALFSVSVRESATTAARVMVSYVANAFFWIALAAVNRG